MSRAVTFALSRRRLLEVASLAAVMAPLAGCVTVLPKSDPIQLYSFRFLSDLAGAGPVDYEGIPKSITLSPVLFSAEAGADRIISREDNELAYIGGARWSVPASDLFAQAVVDGFGALGRKVRLETRSGVAAPLRLDITVSRFEVDYVKRKPVVKIAFEARLIMLKDRATLAAEVFDFDYEVDKNKASSMVAVFEQGVSELVARLVTFCEDKA
jgi:cholesterol transport system auxiliary component